MKLSDIQGIIMSLHKYFMDNDVVKYYKIKISSDLIIEYIATYTADIVENEYSLGQEISLTLLLSNTPDFKIKYEVLNIKKKKEI